MQTTTTIKAYAYPVKIKDHRSGVSNSDTIVIPAEWLRICGWVLLGCQRGTERLKAAMDRTNYS